MSLAPRPLISLATGLLLGLGAVAAVPAAPARAASWTYLCTGYTACAAAGYSSSGYAQASGSSYWQMYSGHNCTNYAAYRMVLAGMPNTRPFTGTGNAWNWGVQLASKTDQVPTVGAVAWFAKGVGGAGSLGHVAYVEQVVSPTEIVISEDSWEGNFHWRRINTAAGWPSGFIHLTDRALVNTAPVTVSGTPAVGQTLTAAPGSWSAAAAYAYQWWADGAPIPGATAPTLKLTSAYAGKNLVMRVTATLAGYSPTTADSAPVAVTLGQLASSGAPAVTGAGSTPLVGETLTASQPTFSPAPRTVGVQWYADGAPIAGATGWTYALTGDTVLKSVTAVATARRPGYAPTPAASAPVGPVLAGKVAVDEKKGFAVTGPAAVGKRLRVTSGRVSPKDATSTFAWLRDGAPIEGATASTYRVSEADAGAQLSVAVTTAKTGWLSQRTVLTREARVLAKPTFKVKTLGGRGVAVVWFRVSAPGIDRPSATAVVTVGGVARTVRVSRGIGKVTLRGLRAGRQQVSIALSATDRLNAATVTDKVKVRR